MKCGWIASYVRKERKSSVDGESFSNYDFAGQRRKLSFPLTWFNLAPLLEKWSFMVRLTLLLIRRQVPVDLVLAILARNVVIDV